MVTVVIPACNEAGFIEKCLASLVQSDDPGEPVQVIVAANNCTDATISIAESLRPDIEARGWRFDVLEIAGGGKIKALNAADGLALYENRLYLDADIIVSPGLLAEVATALASPRPVFAAGKVTIPRARSWVSERYARFWLTLPFHGRGVPGCGAFAVNGPGRRRWQMFPDVISDDTFARLNFGDHERVSLTSTYSWPITEGFAPLVRVRRRQNVGVSEIRAQYPRLAAEAAPTAPNARETFSLFRKDPLGFLIYAAVSVAVTLPVFRNRGHWDRGRDLQPVRVKDRTS